MSQIFEFVLGGVDVFEMLEGGLPGLFFMMFGSSDSSGSAFVS